MTNALCTKWAVEGSRKISEWLVVLHRLRASSDGKLLATGRAEFPERGKDMKSIFVKSLSLVTVLGMGAQGLLNAADCLPSAPNGWLAFFTMTTLKNYASGNPYASYVAGIFYTSNSPGFLGGSETFASSGSTQLFSDRQANEGCVGLLCTLQPFDINQANSLGVSVTKSWTIVINGGGNGVSYSGTLTGSIYGKTTFPLTCDATTGILHGNIDSQTHVAITTGPPQSPPK
jgi:hypothetical protein